MSSRARRKILKQQEEQRSQEVQAPEAEEDGSEGEPGPASRANLFAVLNQTVDGDQDDEVETGEAEGEEIAPDSGPADDATTPKSNSKKKKKKRKAKAENLTHEPNLSKGEETVQDADTLCPWF